MRTVYGALYLALGAPRSCVVFSRKTFSRRKNAAANFFIAWRKKNLLSTLALLCLISGAILAPSSVLSAATEKREAIPSIETEKQSIKQLLLQAEAKMQSGSYFGAKNLLMQAVAKAETFENPRYLVTLLSRLTLVYTELNQFDLGIASGNRGVAIAEQNNYTVLLVTLHNDLGNLYTAQGNSKQAFEHYIKSADIAKAEGLTNLLVIAALNSARESVVGENNYFFRHYMREVEEAIQALPDDSKKIEYQLTLGDLYRQAARKNSANRSYRLNALTTLKSGLAIAENTNDQRLKSYCLGYIARLYQDEGRSEEALKFARQAVFAAQTAVAPESSYQWEWLIAQLLKKQGKLKESAAVYQQAISTLRVVRAELDREDGLTFKQRVGAVFFEYADLLLSQDYVSEGHLDHQMRLLEVRNVLEEVKLAEVEDYFENQCVVSQGEDKLLDKVSSSSAIIYPIQLKDRLELLVSIDGVLTQITSKVHGAKLTEEVRSLRLNIETLSAEWEYLPASQKLYDWLVRPLEPTLAANKVDTLVMVPDGALRTIPMAVLHDGKNFLIEKFALATTPGITLTEPQPIQRNRVSVMANGLTEAVQGYSSLPNVAEELAFIQKTFKTKLYQDQSFQLSEVEKELSVGDYSIVHFATHGEFNSDHSESFLLTHDSKLTMDRLDKSIGLRRFNNEPIELLVLSACQTAAGDDRAALGLAGIALRAGARSAMATLWFINDRATSELVTTFYDQLSSTKQSKAKALQQAQLSLLTQPKYSHPTYWAPFLMIGNWL